MAIPVAEPRIARFEMLGYGMFIHWGLYAQLGQGEWVQNQRNIPMDEYAKLKETFTAEDFDGPEIERIARESGMKYITLTSRHHDGFSLYDKRGRWRSRGSGSRLLPRRHAEGWMRTRRTCRCPK